MSVAAASSSSSSSSCLPPPPPPPPPRPPPPRRPPRRPHRPRQLRPAIHSVPCRTSTTTIHAQCSLPDLNHDHPRPVFPAGPQPRVSTPNVPAGPHVGRYGTKNVQKKVRKNVRKNVRRYARRYAR